MTDTLAPRWSTSQWALRRWLTVAITLLVVVLTGAVVAVALAIMNLGDAREHLVDKIDPAIHQAQRIEAAAQDQRAGAGGYTITGERAFLDSYAEAAQVQRDATQRLRPLLDGLPEIAASLDTVSRETQRWRTEYAEPNIRHYETTGKEGSLVGGAERFAPVRGALGTLDLRLDTARAEGREALADASDYIVQVCTAIAVTLLLVFLAATLAMRQAVVGPIGRLATAVRRVADGDFQHEVRVTGGPKEVIELSGDVDQMRKRIVTDLAAQREVNAELDVRTEDLARSNAELEQFAYVASHDLQEPLRKVASFCQLLERRYKGQLDERADQYIGFAVDGAKRMQVLINDLLAFSRVGRHPTPQVEIECADLVDQAKADLAELIEESDAKIEVGPLPTVVGERALLAGVFQNLIGNAVKFRGEDPPRVRIDAVRKDEDWEFSVSDNGIGIAPEYAERVFVIFQRLHAKEAYEGTGIGLAMCRKIIEYHGGRIWIDTEEEPGALGTEIRFTLPVHDPQEKPEEARE
ncbi:sensor histidine kinase [Actinokineospora xionganensis]|uniref:histidine kinase n=1 Tax=Actinokineospora xionganensis TaxID=2684470 RepID=A0ABR7LGG9_9PSEU|nr:ATP-binding protein [Actinokineospora xionganensis]MBC6451662.1 CHASE3 domain-containing protein [Actinokineospora xionganensis]